MLQIRVPVLSVITIALAQNFRTVKADADICAPEISGVLVFHRRSIISVSQGPMVGGGVSIISALKLTQIIGVASAKTRST